MTEFSAISLPFQNCTTPNTYIQPIIWSVAWFSFFLPVRLDPMFKKQKTATDKIKLYQGEEFYEFKLQGPLFVHTPLY